MTKQNKNDRFLLLFEIYSTDNHMTKQSIILKNSGTIICAPINNFSKIIQFFCDGHFNFYLEYFVSNMGCNFVNVFYGWVQFVTFVLIFLQVDISFLNLFICFHYWYKSDKFLFFLFGTDKTSHLNLRVFTCFTMQTLFSWNDDGFSYKI